MASTPNIQAKLRTRGNAGGAKARGPSYIIAEVMGDPAKVLASLKVPAGVPVAVVATGATAEQHPVLAAPDQFTVIVEGAKPSAQVLERFYARLKAVSAEPRTSHAPAIDRQAFEPDARARALLRGRKIAEADLRGSGGAYDLQAVRTLMQGVSRQRIDKQVREGSLLAVPGPSNRRHYPTVQFQADGTVVKGLKAVREALPTQNPWAVLNFLVQPDDRLNGRKPIDVLKAGAVEDVVDAARSIGQQGG